MSPRFYSAGSGGQMNRISKGVLKGEGIGKGGAGCTLKGKGAGGGCNGFTLVELLAVIAIIALLAGIVVGVSGTATIKSREGRMRAEHAELVTAIETYKLELG